jgi:hypothetical protein
MEIFSHFFEKFFKIGANFDIFTYILGLKSKKLIQITYQKTYEYHNLYISGVKKEVIE